MQKCAWQCQNCFSGFYFFILPMNDIELFEVIKPKQNLLHQRECVNFLQTSVFVDVAFESHIAIFHHEIKQRILDELFFFFLNSIMCTNGKLMSQICFVKWDILPICYNIGRRWDGTRPFGWLRLFVFHGRWPSTQLAWPQCQWVW